tara:strand:- start:100 stop:351 length:252 start_codon:yes stop_codon:yes gene_type:complete
MNILKKMISALIVVCLLTAPVMAKNNKTIDLGEQRIEGRLTKPEVFFILKRSWFYLWDWSFKKEMKEKTFVHLIISDAETNPF